MTIDEDNPMWYDDAEINAATVSAAVLRVDELRAALLDTHGLDKIPEPEPLIDGIIHRDNLVWLIGKSGDGKSFVALDMAGCIGTGRDWHGHPTTTGPVLYIAAEGATGVRWRVRAWETHHDTDMANVRWLPRPVQAALELDWHALIDLTRELNPILVVIDTQARVTVGMEENAAKDMGMFVDQIEQLRQAGHTTVMIVHHQGRNGEHMRGSTALEGAAGTVIRVVKEENELTLTCEKQKDAEPFEEIKLRLTPTLDSAVVMLADSMSQAAHANTAAMKMARTWWDLLGTEQLTVSKAIDAGITSTKPSFYRNVKPLVRSGLVFKEIIGRSVRFGMVRNPDEDETAGQDQWSGEVRSGPVDPGGPVRWSTTPIGVDQPDLEPDPTPLCHCGQRLMNTKSIVLGTCARCRQENP